MQYDQLSNHTLLSMTLLHGRLLHGCGFTKRVSVPSLSGNWAPTGMRDRRVLSYLSPTRRGRLSSGRPAMQSIPRTAAPSTSALALREILFMQRFGVTEQVLRETTACLMDSVQWCWSKTSSAPSRLEQRAVIPMPSWEPVPDSTPSHSYSNVGALSAHGLITTLRATEQDHRQRMLSALSALRLGT